MALEIEGTKLLSFWTGLLCGVTFMLGLYNLDFGISIQDDRYKTLGLIICTVTGSIAFGSTLYLACTYGNERRTNSIV